MAFPSSSRRDSIALDGTGPTSSWNARQTFDSVDPSGLSANVPDLIGTGMLIPLPSLYPREVGLSPTRAEVLMERVVCG